jgi:hypothetical protein
MRIHLPVILQPTKIDDDDCLSFNDHWEKKLFNHTTFGNLDILFVGYMVHIIEIFTTFI